MDDAANTDPTPMLDLLIWRLAEAKRVVIETPNALGLADAHYVQAKPILDALVGNRSRIEALEAENAALREALQSLRALDEIEVYRAIKRFKAVKHMDIARAISAEIAADVSALLGQTEGEG